MKRTFTEKDQKELEDGVIAEIDKQNEPGINQGDKMNTCKDCKWLDGRQCYNYNFTQTIGKDHAVQIRWPDKFGCYYFNKKETPCCGICIEMTKADKTGH